MSPREHIVITPTETGVDKQNIQKKRKKWFNPVLIRIALMQMKEKHNN